MNLAGELPRDRQSVKRGCGVLCFGKRKQATRQRFLRHAFQHVKPRRGQFVQSCVMPDRARGNVQFGHDLVTPYVVKDLCNCFHASDHSVKIKSRNGKIFALHGKALAA
jgi:hypothetical protein